MAPLAVPALLVASIWVTVAAPALGSDFTIVDRRAVDGSVLVLPRVPAERPGPDPFVAATAWDLTPAGKYFRVRSDRIRARTLDVGDLLPATSFEDGEVVANSPVSALGGGASSTFELGEVVRLIGLNTAFKSVRMDLEAVCRRDRQSDRPLRGRAIFVLSGQVGKKTLAEANSAVSAELEPVGLPRVVRQCDPATGEPPFALRPGQSASEVVDWLGPPASRALAGEVEVLDYGEVLVHLSKGRVTRLVVPALD